MIILVHTGHCGASVSCLATVAITQFELDYLCARSAAQHLIQTCKKGQYSVLLIVTESCIGLSVSLHCAICTSGLPAASAVVSSTRPYLMSTHANGLVNSAEVQTGPSLVAGSNATPSLSSLTWQTCRAVSFSAWLLLVHTSYFLPRCVLVYKRVLPQLSGFSP